MKLTHLAMALHAVLLCGGVLAAAPPAHREVWVPASELELVLKKFPKAVMLSRDQYERLMRDAKRTAVKSPLPPERAVAVSARYEAIVQNDAMEGTGELIVRVLGDDWAYLPFRISDATLGSVSVDDQVALESGRDSSTLLLRGKGEHKIQIRFSARVSSRPGERRLAFQVPGGAATTLRLPIPAGVEITSGNPVRLETAQGQTVATFAMPEGKLDTTYRFTAGGAGQGAFVSESLRISSLLELDRIFTNQSVELTASLGPLPGVVELVATPGSAIIKLEGPDVAAWSATGERIRVQLQPGSRQSTTLQLEIQRDAASGKQTIPFAIVAGAGQSRGTVEIGGSRDVRVGDIEFSTLAVPLFAEMTFQENKPANFAGRYEFLSRPGPVAVTSRPIGSRMEADLDTLVSVKKEGLYIDRTVTVRPLEGERHMLRITLPEGEDLLGVYDPQRRELNWNYEGKQVAIQFTQEATTAKPVEVRIETRQRGLDFEQVPNDGVHYSVKDLGIADCERVTGYVAMKRDPSLRVITGTEEGLELRDGRTAPVPGELAWFRRDEFDLKLKIEKRSARVETSLAAYALPLANALSIRGEITYTIQNTGVREFRIRVEKERADTFHFEGADIAERDLKGDVWTIRLNRDVAGSYSLKFSTQIPVERKETVFSTAVPFIEPLDSAQNTGTWAIEANTDTEVRCEAHDMSELDSLRPPVVSGYTPQHRVITVFRSFGAAWTLRIHGERHESAALTSTVVDNFTLQTVVATSGPTRSRLDLQMRTAGDQYLTVTLPKGGRLLSLAVDGELKKPTGADPEQVRIPLPATAGDRQVKLVYEQPGKDFRSSGSTLVDAPKLDPAIPVLEIQWRAWLPEGYEYSGFKSNLVAPPQEPYRALISKLLKPSSWSGRRRVLESSGIGDPRGMVEEMPAAAAPLPLALDRKPATASVEEKLSSIIIPRINFIDGTVGEAVAFLKQKTVQLDTADQNSAKRGVNISIDKSLLEQQIGPQNVRITISLQSVPLGEVLKYVADQANLKLKVDSSGVTLVPISEPTNVLLTKEYKIPPGFIPQELVNGAARTDQRSAGRVFLEQQGVSFPPGASAVYFLASKRLVVRNTQENLDLLDTLVEAGLHTGAAAMPGIAGLLTLELDVPAVGIPFAFFGDYRPEFLRFNYTEHETRAWHGWWALILGGVLFWIFGKARPIWSTVWALFLCTAIPLVFWSSSLPFFNHLLGGWLIVAVLRAIARRLTLPRNAASAAAAVALVLLVAPRTEAQHAIVPYDPLKPVSGQKPDRVYVPYDRFEHLWNQAKEHRRPPLAAKSGLAYTLDNATYDAVLERDRITISLHLDLHTFDRDWVTVPIQFKNCVIGSLTLDGRPADPGSAGELTIEKPGVHRVQAVLVVPNPKPGHLLGVPQTAATHVSFTLPENLSQARIEPSKSVMESVLPGKKKIAASVGATNEIKFLWDTAVTSGIRAADPASANVTTSLVLSTASEIARTQFAFAFPGARMDRFQVLIDRSTTLTQLEGEGIASWKIEEAGEYRRLSVTLNQPVSDAYSMTATCERAITPPFTSAAPRFQAMAKRTEQLVGIFRQNVDVSLENPNGARRAEWPASGPENAKAVAAYAFSGTPVRFPYRVELAETEFTAKVQYLYQVARRKTDIMVAFRLSATNKTAGTAPVIGDVEMDLPEGCEIQTVQGTSVRDWWRDGNRLRIRFTGAEGGDVPVLVYLFRQYPAPPPKIDVASLKLAGFKEVTGSALVAADRSLDPSLALSGEAKEIDPKNSESPFELVAPLERKRAFTFKDQEFSGAVTLNAVAPRYGIAWASFAKAREGWTTVATRVRVTVRKGAPQEIAFRVPATAPVMSVSGPDVREALDRVNEGWREYTVSFQNPISSKGEFDVEVDLPGEAVTLPGFEFPGSDSSDGYVIAGNDSDYELSLDPKGLDIATLGQVPFAATTRPGAQVFRVRPGWSLGMKLARLDRTESRQAFVPWAEFTTAFRENGEEWHRATFRLMNRSMQFLPVRMPTGSKLVSVSVAETPVRADKGKAEGKEVILVPLIKTKPGELAYDVSVVYTAARRGILGLFGRRSIDDLELPGITVERTIWNVWIPDGYDTAFLGNRVGNMDLVVGEAIYGEKMEAALHEVSSLKRAALSAKSQADRELAKRNLEQLEQSVSANAPADESAFAGLEKKAKEVAGAIASVQRKRAQSQATKMLNELRLIESQVTELEKAVKEDGLTAKVTATNAWAKNAEAGDNVPLLGDVKVGGKDKLALNDNVFYSQAAPRSEGRADTTRGGEPISSPVQPGRYSFGSDRLVAQPQESNIARALRNAEKRELTATLSAPATEATPHEKDGDVANFTGVWAKPATESGGVDWSMPPGLVQEGRIALPVEFKTHGTVLHLWKLKSNAGGSVWIIDSKLPGTLWRILLFLCGALLLTFMPVLTSQIRAATQRSVLCRS